VREERCRVTISVKFCKKICKILPKFCGFLNILQNFQKIVKIFAKIFKFLAEICKICSREDDFLVDFEKCCKMRIWTRKSASIQPRTSLRKSDGSWPNGRTACPRPRRRRGRSSSTSRTWTRAAQARRLSPTEDWRIGSLRFRCSCDVIILPHPELNP